MRFAHTGTNCFQGLTCNRFLAGEALSPAEEDQLALKVEEWRQRLMDIS